MTDRFLIAPMEPGDPASCEGLLRALPEWFGIEEAILDYRKDIETLETHVARVSGDLAGFITVKRHFPTAAEIVVMAVDRSYHRRGVGSLLIRHVEEIFRGGGVKLLQVKTLGPSRPNAEYAGTRRFYASQGFYPLEETALWGEVNPCLILVKSIGEKP